MPLAVYTNDPSFVVYPDDVISDLLVCIDQDPGLSVDHSDARGLYMGYARTEMSFGAQRVADIINSSFTELLGVAGVDSSAYIDGAPITSYAGVTYPPDASGNIGIVYDIEECNGNGYYVYDASGNPIAMPRYVILFHEMAHGFQWATFGATTEYDAETDENRLRAEDFLPLRDPTSHAGGCGDTIDNCFIATAARAHFRGNDLREMWWIRDRVLRRDPLGRSWFDSLYAEYDQYSVTISADMTRDPDLSHAVYWLAVRPLLSFYSFVRDWSISRVVGNTLQRLGIERDIKCFAAEWRISRFGSSDARAVAALIKALSDEAHQPQVSLGPPTNYRDPTCAIRYLRGAFASVDRPLPLTRWAILEPLSAWWSVVCDFQIHYDLARGVEAITSFIREWITRIPDAAGHGTIEIVHLDACVRRLLSMPSTVAGRSI